MTENANVPPDGSATSQGGGMKFLGAAARMLARAAMVIGTAFVALLVVAVLIHVFTRGSGFKWADKEPSWSPNGREFAFASNRANPHRKIFSIYVEALRGRSARRVSFAGNAKLPVWSPNGRRLAYVEDTHSGRTSVVHVVNEDGSRNTSLNPSVKLSHGIKGLAWSPNGRWLAIDACHRPCPYAPGSFYASLYIVHPNGRGLRRIAANADTFAWAPAGGRLVHSDPHTSEGLVRGEKVFMTRVGAQKRTLLAILPFEILSSSWSRSGAIAVTSAENYSDFAGVGYDHLRVSTIGSSLGGERTIRKLGDTRDWVNVAWVPRAHALLYFRSCDALSGPGWANPNHISGVYTTSTLRRTTRVISTDGCDAVPSPDGKSVLFVRGHADSSSAVFLAATSGSSSSQVTQK